MKPCANTHRLCGMRGQADVPTVEESKGKTSGWVEGWVAIAAGAKDAMRCAARGRQLGASPRPALDGQQGDAAARNAAPMQLQCMSANPRCQVDSIWHAASRFAFTEAAARSLSLSLCWLARLARSHARASDASWVSRCCNFGAFDTTIIPAPLSSVTPPSSLLIPRSFGSHHLRIGLHLPSKLPFPRSLLSFGSAHIRLRPQSHPQIAGRSKYYIHPQPYAASSPPSIPHIACFVSYLFTRQGETSSDPRAFVLLLRASCSV